MKRKIVSILVVLQISAMLFATDVICTSFEVQDGYPAGNISGVNQWVVSSENATVSTANDRVHSGLQGLCLTSTDKLQAGHIAYTASEVGLGGVVYIDFYIRVHSLPTSNLSVTCYDLSGNHRSAMVELTTAGKIKVYNGSSGYSNQPSFPLQEWMRFSFCIDYTMHQYQFALNGEVWQQRMNFREIKNGATDIDYHELRFLVGSGSADVSVDDMYISSTPIEDIAFQDPVNTYTVSVEAAFPATITLSPSSGKYEEGTIVTATCILPDCYELLQWTGDLTGQQNPITFSVDSNMTIGCTIAYVPQPVQTRYVATAAQFKQALTQMNPGDSILLADGNYDIGGVSITRTGTQDLPIHIMAEHPLAAHIVGSSYITLKRVEYIEIRGIDFDVNAVASIIKMEGANHIRVTRCRMTMEKESDTQTSKWVLIGDVWNADTCTSHHNRIDHNLFENKLDGGAWVVIDGCHGTPRISQYDRIDHNIFRNNTPRMDNEKETLRMGVSDLSMQPAYTTVEYNLFEDCDGDPEIVSGKSCNNVVRYNTFRRCLGTVCLRQGMNNEVVGNIFLGENKTAYYEESEIGCGGVRVYGKDHIITGNYMQNLSGRTWDPALALTNGDVLNTSNSLSSHFVPENILFSNNTLVDNFSDVEIAYANHGKYGHNPIHCRIEQNLFVNHYGTIVTEHSALSDANVAWSNNAYWADSSVSVGRVFSTSEMALMATAPSVEIPSCVLTEEMVGPTGEEDIQCDTQTTTIQMQTNTQRNAYIQLVDGELIIVCNDNLYTILGQRK